MGDRRSNRLHELADALLPRLQQQNYWDPRNDPATWQHMNTYAIGLGLNGFNGTVNATAGYLPLWGGQHVCRRLQRVGRGYRPLAQDSDDSAGNVADLWHAAINGRGVFSAPTRPQQLKAFRSIFARANNQVTSGGQVTGTSRRVSAGSQTFDVSYTPRRIGIRRSPRTASIRMERAVSHSGLRTPLCSLIHRLATFIRGILLRGRHGLSLGHRSRPPRKPLTSAPLASPRVTRTS